MLMSRLHSNPHSSDDQVTQVDSVRKMVLDHFNTDTDHYSLVFTSGATAGIKMVAECFPWSHDVTDDNCGDVTTPGHLVLHEDCHTSVLGIRQLALSR